MTRLWLVRHGSRGEYEAMAMEQNMLTIDFRLRGDVAALSDRERIQSALTEAFPDAKENTLKNFAAQVNQFVNVAQDGDFVVSPMKTTSTIWIGRIAAKAINAENGLTQRPVGWLRTEVARDAFRQDLLYSFGAFMTVCEISRNNALSRVQSVIDTGKDPGDGVRPNLRKSYEPETQEASDQQINLERIARDQIEARISSSFAGHAFTDLIAAILEAQGYVTRVSPPGADRGVDIVAGSGPLGLESPRITVQVKSGDYRVDQPDLQALIGSVSDTHADHGLIASWSGFTSAARGRINELFFRVRLWGRDEIVDNLLDVYDRLPETIRAELPLRRTWMVVMEGEAD
ncbi:MAG: restriction endonuclease [Amphiplicatus sp.]|nr:restriction endonuclease [Amphiplicatus sp.]